ncbi:hypothetical protein BL250_15115 [Erwinia sp. OLTSP20]|uniref:fimbrial protein n=1 Tax=unclassified Erwinia TaxID=2622719 RepID=UPI000C3BA6EF|nr:MULTISPECIES: fimbrial protein [unclassified Erwinia]PIJ48167.1 hypothetical protein BV501_18115 [Erwinia sp. OAMSP11]PIJ67066.1 hypothetical protein BK416_17155 [Erwinia sp. OLSSP12]PIJ78373.1 hypothetical protein BLD47_17285 [Erwinia sp. OLCASP19]PIJ79124.1 hypothetical protein BLD46_17345 [Erwinia sp. OLMTSP26]PIJ79981.1 hypothetical protein BLD49_17295 [Erwinia sp. OLMDSP33]
MKIVRLQSETGVLLSMLLTLSLCFISKTSQAEDLIAETRIKVNVFTDACNIKPGDEAIQLDFGTIVKKYLYLHQTTPSKPFSIHLIKCKPDLAKTVSVTFSGLENQALTGKLAFNPGSLARGAAIGLTTPDGQPVMINSTKHTYPLSSGAMQLDYLAYIQGEPQALSAKKIIAGTFSASAIFSLSYQ